jgi:predicted MPP superfamily phosphohydrolase
VTALAFVVPTLAAGRLLPGPLALVVGLGLWLATARRVQRLLGDPVRSRLVVRLLDEPMFWLWGAGILGLPLLLLGGLVSATGCAPVAPVHFGFLDAALGSFGLGLLVSGWSLWGRRRFVRVRQIEVRIEGLPERFEGYRIAHLSDLHIGSYDPKTRGLEWVRLANALKPDLSVVTGDLVTSGAAYHADAAEVVAALRATDGVLVCMGNHDQCDNDALTRELTERGVRVLKNEWLALERGDQKLIVAGVDDAYTAKSDLDRTLGGRPRGAPTILLAHYPSFFRHALGKDVALTLSGHTHGGQFGVPFFADRWNIARAAGQASRGLRVHGSSALHVSAGLGTTGPPMRLGVPPEIALLVLRATQPEKSSNMPSSA